MVSRIVFECTNNNVLMYYIILFYFFKRDNSEHNVTYYMAILYFIWFLSGKSFYTIITYSNIYLKI